MVSLLHEGVIKLVRDLAQLERWLDRSLVVSSIDELLSL